MHDVLTTKPEVENATCPSQLLAVGDALDILNGKWKVPVIVSLSFGKRRFKELQREITGVTGKMLSQVLKELEINELVKRTVYDTKPVTVEYELTTYGRTLEKVIEALVNWGTLHRTRVISNYKKHK